MDCSSGSDLGVSLAGNAYSSVPQLRASWLEVLWAACIMYEEASG